MAGGLCLFLIIGMACTAGPMLLPHIFALDHVRPLVTLGLVASLFQYFNNCRFISFPHEPPFWCGVAHSTAILKDSQQFSTIWSRASHMYRAKLPALTPGELVGPLTGARSIHCRAVLPYSLFHHCGTGRDTKGLPELSSGPRSETRSTRQPRKGKHLGQTYDTLGTYDNRKYGQSFGSPSPYLAITQNSSDPSLPTPSFLTQRSHDNITTDHSFQQHRRHFGNLTLPKESAKWQHPVGTLASIRERSRLVISLYLHLLAIAFVVAAVYGHLNRVFAEVSLSGAAPRLCPVPGCIHEVDIHTSDLVLPVCVVIPSSFSSSFGSHGVPGPGPWEGGGKHDENPFLLESMSP
ncbi:hypothetical protein B0H66DRAFT_622553 [Apodospora peruviana]|uniref:Uncharacterized protein n=1 Tax=Apodospora peruviana TaxID=516989 RepID=A0AAE0I519_9PEZI|nr:hypothetical protein B0H66DRAFT_622553 [Apodospora peruviana]